MQTKLNISTEKSQAPWLEASLVQGILSLSNFLIGATWARHYVHRVSLVD